MRKMWIDYVEGLDNFAFFVSVIGENEEVVYSDVRSSQTTSLHRSSPAADKPFIGDFLQDIITQYGVEKVLWFGYNYFINEPLGEKRLNEISAIVADEL